MLTLSLMPDQPMKRREPNTMQGGSADAEDVGNVRRG
jgi:hypothetical protein